MIWLIPSLLFVSIAAVLSFSFFASRNGPSGKEADVYRAQLLEVEQEETTGLMSAEDARLARVEIKRRLASTKDRLDKEGNGQMRRSEQVTLIAVIASVCLGSVWLYSLVGSPFLASHPPTSMGDTRRIDPPSVSGMPSANGAQPLASVGDMIGQLEARLEANPQDVEGWRMLGWSHFRMGNLDGARAAYGTAIELDPSNADVSSAYGEVLVRLANGRITDEAVEAFREALTLAPQNPRARFLLGLRKEQDGDPEAAIADWLALLETADANDDWAGDVRSRVIELATLNGIGLPEGFEATSPDVRGPSQADIAAANELSNADRASMIQGMVDGLDARLRDNPNDLAGWVQLIRSYRVLDQPEHAQDAYQRAQLAFVDNSQALANLEIAARAPLPGN